MAHPGSRPRTPHIQNNGGPSHARGAANGQAGTGHGAANGLPATRRGAVADPGAATAAPGIPVAAMVESIVGCKWSVRLLQLCAEGQRRPSEFLRACPGLSAKVMNERWRKMLRFGIVTRTVCGDKPPVEVEYRLTPFGQQFLTILDEVRRLQEAVDAGLTRSQPPTTAPD